MLAPGADVRLGDASALPWDNAVFDVVVQSTVFSSVIDAAMKWSIAGEMLRVLKPGGFILWYDFRYNNPWNPHVRGVGWREIKSLFPDRRRRLRRATLAPPLARRLVPLTWIGSLALEGLRFLNTHYIGLFRKGEAFCAGGVAEKGPRPVALTVPEAEVDHGECEYRLRPRRMDECGTGRRGERRSQ